MHYHYLEDDLGDIVDTVPFCSDSCHRQWCYDTNTDYYGWNGCHEAPDYEEECTFCNVTI